MTMWMLLLLPLLPFPLLLLSSFVLALAAESGLLGLSEVLMVGGFFFFLAMNDGFE